jgi:hypothetical protein
MLNLKAKKFLPTLMHHILVLHKDSGKFSLPNYLGSRYPCQATVCFIYWMFSDTTEVRLQQRSSPNHKPHCFKAITKAVDTGWKEPTIVSQPCTAQWGEGGGDCSAPLKICLIKHELHLNYHQKRIEIDIFIETLWNKKACKDILRGVFDF